MSCKKKNQCRPTKGLFLVSSQDLWTVKKYRLKPDLAFKTGICTNTKLTHATTLESQVSRLDLSVSVTSTNIRKVNIHETTGRIGSFWQILRVGGATLSLKFWLVHVQRRRVMLLLCFVRLRSGGGRVIVTGKLWFLSVGGAAFKSELWLVLCERRTLLEHQLRRLGVVMSPWTVFKLQIWLVREVDRDLLVLRGPIGPPLQVESGSRGNEWPLWRTHSLWRSVTSDTLVLFPLLRKLANGGRTFTPVTVTEPSMALRNWSANGPQVKRQHDKRWQRKGGGRERRREREEEGERGGGRERRRFNHRVQKIRSEQLKEIHMHTSLRETTPTRRPMLVT